MRSKPAVWWVLALSLSGCAGNLQDPRRVEAQSDEKLLLRGTAAFYEGSYTIALERFEKALGHYLSYDDLEGVMRSRLNIAETAMAMRRLTLVGEQLAAISQLLEHPGQIEYQMRYQLLAAALAMENEHYGQANALLKQVLESAVGEHRMKALALQAQAAVRAKEPDAEDHLLVLRNANKQGQSGYLDNQALIQLLSGLLAMAAGDFQGADRELQGALRDYKTLHQRPGIASTLEQMAHLAKLRRDWLAADRLLRRALPVRVWLTDRKGVIGVLSELLEINRRLQRADEVKRLGHELKRFQLSR